MTALQDPIVLLFVLSAAFVGYTRSSIPAAGLILGIGGIISLSDDIVRRICNYALLDYHSEGALIFLTLVGPFCFAWLAFYRYVFFTSREAKNSPEE